MANGHVIQCVVYNSYCLTMGYDYDFYYLIISILNNLLILITLIK